MPTIAWNINSLLLYNFFDCYCCCCDVALAIWLFCCLVIKLKEVEFSVFGHSYLSGATKFWRMTQLKAICSSIRVWTTFCELKNMCISSARFFIYFFFFAFMLRDYNHLKSIFIFTYISNVMHMYIYLMYVSMYIWGYSPKFWSWGGK